MRQFSVRPVHGFAMIVSVTVAACALAIANGCSGGGDAISGDEAGASSSSGAASSSSSSGATTGGSSSSGGSSSGGSSGGSSGTTNDAGSDAAVDSGPKTCKTPADCEDNSPCTTAECGLDGFCKYTVAGDGDGDGYASSALGACGKDCDDGDPLVNPDSGWYEKARDGGSYDWNCDGFAQPRWNTLWKGCNVSQGKCVGSGWATKIRGCGERGTYVNCFVSNGECASFDYVDSGQECR